MEARIASAQKAYKSRWKRIYVLCVTNLVIETRLCSVTFERKKNARGVLGSGEPGHQRSREEALEICYIGKIVAPTSLLILRMDFLFSRMYCKIFWCPHQF